MKKLGRQICGIAVVGGLLWVGSASATTICELDITAPEITNTGVCGQVITVLDGVLVEDLDESISVASAAAQQGVNPPASDSDGTSGTAGGTFPASNGIGGLVDAAAFVSGGGGALGEISSTAGSFFIGEFIADDGLPGNTPFDLTVNLGISGSLFVDNAVAALFVGVAAVDSLGQSLIDPATEFSGGVALLASIIGFSQIGFTNALDFTQTGTCLLSCEVVVATTESIVLESLVDDDLFGLFVTIEAFAILPNGVLSGAAHSNFADTVDIGFEGGNVTAVAPQAALPEPASIVLVLVGLLGVGFARRRTP